MKLLYSIKTSDLIKNYKSFGTDISGLIIDVDQFDLYEKENGLRIWSPQIPGDSKFYNDLAMHNEWYYSSDKEEFDLALEFIKKGSVLEVGCGEGKFAKKIIKKSYTGLELNESAVKKALKNGFNVLNKDFKTFSQFNEKYFDNVCSFQLLEHLVKPEDYFISANKVLKKNGILITSVPSEDSFIGTLKNSCLNAPPHHLTKWTDKCLRNLPCRYGFKCVDLIHITLEKQHYKWFWNNLIISDIKGDKAELDIIDKIKIKLYPKILRFLGIANYVPKEFNIPGHTIVSIHKKVSNI